MAWCLIKLGTRLYDMALINPGTRLHGILLN
jgi:hypothetical protein